jgi:hypothetical protein
MHTSIAAVVNLLVSIVFDLQCMHVLERVCLRQLQQFSGPIIEPINL